MRPVIRLRLDRYLDENNITRYALAQITGIPYQTIDKYYKNQVFRYDAYNLGKIMDTLKCGFEDLLELTQEDEEQKAIPKPEEQIALPKPKDQNAGP